MDQGWIRSGPTWYRFGPLLDRVHFGPPSVAPSVHFNDIPRERESRRERERRRRRRRGVVHSTAHRCRAGSGRRASHAWDGDGGSREGMHDRVGFSRIR